MKWIKSRTRLSIRNVLCPTDFSQCSERALSYAEAIARRYGANVCVLHVITADRSPAPPVGSERETRESASRKILDCLDRGLLLGIPREFLVEEGDITNVFPRVIREHQIDLTVLGIRDYRETQGSMLGSVADEVVQAASCPVMLVGPRAGFPPPQAEFRRILCATDFSPDADSAVHYALLLAQEHHARLAFLHVVPPAQAQEGWQAEQLWTRLRHVAPAAAELRCNLGFLLEYGCPVERIAGVGKDSRFDLIAVGTSGTGASLRNSPHTFGTTVREVVCTAPCPVITVHTGMALDGLHAAVANAER